LSAFMMDKFILKMFISSLLLCTEMDFYAQVERKSDSAIYWIFMKDKGPSSLMKSDNESAVEILQISPRALERRRKIRADNFLLDHKDLPVYSHYRKTLEDLGVAIRQESRWLNAVSCAIPNHRIETIKALPFVRKIQPLGILKIPEPESADQFPERLLKTADNIFDYGQSLLQNSQIHVPEVHNLGFSGQGVLIGMLDTGFDHDHSIFSRMDIIDEYDFYNQDSVTSNQSGDHRNQHNHGTQTLSIIGGFEEGRLIGPAWGSSYALAKTEWLPTETRIEEDHWVAGIEWLERIGADVVSSSLGYNIFDDSTGYTYEDLNGNTCITTIAADRAASLGVVVVASAGNERDDPWHYILSPADGDSVITVGAITSYERLAYFSSVGPTADGRIKPDVVALGMNNYTMSPTEKNTAQYSYVSGTSFSCPLVAGVCALILEAHSELNPVEVRDALRNTASQDQKPDNDYGWGLIDAYEAVFYHGMIFRNFQMVSHPLAHQKILEMDIISKTGIKTETVRLYYHQAGQSFFTILPATQVNDSNILRFGFLLPGNVDPNTIQFYISVVDTLDQEHIGPIHAPEQLYSFSEGDSSIVPVTLQKTSTIHVFSNYPNPFYDRTTIAFDLRAESKVTIQIFNVIGQSVTLLLDEKVVQGSNRIQWDGLDSSGRKTPSGVYLCVLKTKHKVVSLKMILIR